MKTALVTGIGGQDGSYLAEFLLARGYRVIGIVRNGAAAVPARIAHLADRVALRTADLLDQASLVDAVAAAAPDEVYHLAAQSFVHGSWAQPVLTAEVTGVGPIRLLEAVRQAAPSARVFIASSAEIFGPGAAAPQSEDTPIAPGTPYGAAKALAHWMTGAYRARHGLHAACGIMFNHESPRRGPEFVTRKVTMAAAAVALGQARDVSLGNLDAQRDWGFAGDYVEAMWRMLQLDAPQDFVIGTGTTHSVRDLCRLAFEAVGRDYREHVRVDEGLLRPSDPARLVADPSRAAERLGWRAATAFPDLVRMMVEADLARLRAAGR